jgi:hypothetical protein
VGLFRRTTQRWLKCFTRWVDETGCLAVLAGVAIARATFVDRGIHAERSSTIEAGTGAIER